MLHRFLTVDHATPLLFPPDIREWIPRSHFVHFLIDVVERLDLTDEQITHCVTGDKNYPPRTLLALIVYSYATGTFSSHEIDALTYTNIPARVLCADTHPGAEGILNFRLKNRDFIARRFAEVMDISARCGIESLGFLSLVYNGDSTSARGFSLDFTGVSSPSSHLDPLESVVEDLLQLAEEADGRPNHEETSIPADLCRPCDRRAMLDLVQAEMPHSSYFPPPPDRKSSKFNPNQPEFPLC